MKKHGVRRWSVAKHGVFSLLLSLLISPLLASENPRIANEEGAYVLVLPKSMQNALRKQGLTLWTLRDYRPEITGTYNYSDSQLPFAVIGDFNGDGLLDIVVQGRRDFKSVVVCLFSHKDDVSAVDVTSSA